MNNPITNAASALSNYPAIAKSIISPGIKNAVNQGLSDIFSSQVTKLIGTNIFGIPLVSPRDHFLNQLESWNTSIPTESQWVVLIERLPKNLNTNIIQGLEYTDASKKGWAIDQAVGTLNTYPMQRVMGCLLAQGVSLPTESYTTEFVHPENHRGFLPGLIAKDRENMSQLTIKFLETNTSFTDFVIRPWIILGAHYGFTARNPDIRGEADKNVKTTITVLQYTRTIQSVAMIPRKIWTFYNCAPVMVEGGSLDYSSDLSCPVQTTKWVYSHYTVSNNMYFPLTSIINAIAKKFIPNVGVGTYNKARPLNPTSLFGVAG